MNFTKNIGMLLLALYLILVGIIAITGVVIPSIVLGILALLRYHDSDWAVDLAPARAPGYYR